MTIVNESLRGELSQTPEQGVEAIDSLYTTKGGYDQAEIDARGAALQSLLMDEIRSF